MRQAQHFGTVCAQTFSVLVALWVIRRRKTGISLKKSDFKIERAVIGQVLKIGIPVALQDGFIQVAFMIITVIANSRGVSDAAAVGVVEKVISALFIVPSSMLATVSALSAQNLGAGKEKRATDTLRYATVITTIYGVIVAVLIQFIAENVVGIFTSDTTVVTMGSCLYPFLYLGLHLCGNPFQLQRLFCGMWKVLYWISAQYNFDYICACSGFVSGIEIFYRYAVSNGTCGTGGVTGIRGNLCDCIYIVKEKKPCGTDSMNQDGKSFNR
ncbi:MAG: MATE family efflux transporter [Lachnospira sp.]